MKNKLSVFAVSALFVFSACQKQDDEMSLQKSADVKAAQNELKSAASNRQAVLNFRAHLSGDQEVHHVETNATGQATFQLSRDGESISYRLIVANIENVRMAHIHLAPAGENGPVVVWLYPSAPPAKVIPGRTDGVLQTGIITKDNLIGQLKDQELSALVELMKDGRTYVNVHTVQYPLGEIRGQIFGNVR